ncbi:MAG: hypothetical protein K2X69_10140 [Silvanigrellaceae bacterium]|nr:hypothetical protein [Silvanigrellaceae bacterium]
MKIKVNELPNYNSKMPSSGKAIFSNWIPVDLSFQCCANIVVKKGIKKLDEVKKIEQKGQKANAYFDIVGRPQIFRSSQPYYKSKDEYQIYDDCTLKVLQDHGITRVLSLNEHKANEMNLAKAGIAYHHTLKYLILDPLA